MYKILKIFSSDLPLDRAGQTRGDLRTRSDLVGAPKYIRIKTTITSIKSEENPDPVPPPNEWKIKNPCNPVHDQQAFGSYPKKNEVDDFFTNGVSDHERSCLRYLPYR